MIITVTLKKKRQVTSFQSCLKSPSGLSCTLYNTNSSPSLWAASTEEFGFPLLFQTQGVTMSYLLTNLQPLFFLFLSTASSFYCLGGLCDCSPSPTMGFLQSFAYCPSGPVSKSPPHRGLAWPTWKKRPLLPCFLITPSPFIFFIAITILVVETQLSFEFIK